MLEEMAAGGSTVSDDFMLQEDVKLMVEIGLDVYSFYSKAVDKCFFLLSFFPDGEGPINPKGLQFYNNSRGDSTTEPYLAVHHIFLSHFSVVRLYRRKYKIILPHIETFVGAKNVHDSIYRDEDRAATQRARDFFIGWSTDIKEFITSRCDKGGILAWIYCSPDGSPTLDSFYSKFHNLKRVLEDDSSSDNSSLISSNSDIGSCNIDVT
ncbi:Hydroxyisourate hydrolase [Arachis hypogaea]|nr:Hydroxyisourate hydrolase [Arachis hypogaea]